MRNFIKYFSIKIILVFYILVFTLIPSIILCAFFYSYSVNTITKKYLDNYLDSVYSQCEYNLNAMFYNLNMLILNICSYQELYDVIFDPSYSHEENQEQFRISMEKLFADSSIINGIEVITKHNHYSYFDNNITPVKLTNDYLSTLTGNKLVLNETVTSDSENNKYWVIGKKFYNTYNLYDVGYLVIYVNEAHFEQTYQFPQFKNSSFFITINNLVISHPNKNLIGNMVMIPGNTTHSKEQTIIQSDTESLLIFNTKINNLTVAPALKLYCVMSYNEVYSIVINLNLYTTGLLILCLLISVCIAFFLPKKLLQDVTTLKKQIANFPSIKQFNDHINSNEIVNLENDFINLTKRIDDLIKKNNEEKDSKRIAELRTLQAQINPHFIYNTLDTISWLAKIENQPNIVELSNALASFFRLGLQKGDSFITIHDEIKHVENYLKIEQFRFPDLFDVRYEIDENLTKYKMIKLLLQPLVENCVSHAFEDIEYKGLITIRVFASPDDLNIIQFEVEDNGIGMSFDPRQLPITSNETYNGFGIYNVEQRLLLTYGNEFGLKIKSYPFKGTTVSFKIKKQR